MPMSPRLLRPRASGGGFDPRSIAGLAAWYDISDLSTLFQNSDGTTAAVAQNDPVGYVADKGPSGRHMTQTTNNGRPLLQLSAQNGRTAILFDGINDFLINTSGTNSFMNGSPASMAFVAQRESDNPLAKINQVHTVCGTGRAGLSGETAFIGNLRNTFSTPANRAIVTGNSSRRNGSQSLDTGVSPTSFMICTGGNSDTTVIQTAGNGVTLGAGRDGLTGTVGGIANDSFFLSGRIGEVVLYNLFLSLKERQALERYLSAKWGIAIT